MSSVPGIQLEGLVRLRELEARADWRDALRDRAFRRGLVLLPAGDRALRFYPRYDTEPYAIDEAVSILRTAVEES